MRPRTVVITGASDGIGAAAAAMLSQAGHRLVLVGRSQEKTEAVAERVGAADAVVTDFADLAQVADLADTLRRRCRRIDVLANNAGGLFSGPVLTTDGFERTFQVNHLAPFLLTTRLLDVLVASQAAVVNTSSIGARLFGNLDVDDLQNLRHFRPNKAYGDTKLENVLVTRELHRRYGDRGLTSVAFHPGNVATSFASDTTSWFRWVYHTVAKRLVLITPERGGANLAHFVGGVPGADWESGAFYGSNRRPSRTNPQADDPALAAAVWRASADLLGVPEDPLQAIG